MPLLSVATVGMCEGEQCLEFFFRAKDTVAISFVYYENVADLHYARLYRLNVIAHSRYKYDDRYIGRFNDLDLILADSDGFYYDLFKSGCVEDGDCVNSRSRKAAEIAPRRHRTNEDILIQSDRANSDTVA